MTEPLLSPSDFALFQAKDPAWFLGAVGETIRDYCGWHIWPVASVTGVQCKIGNKGIIMLPTMHLLSLDAIALDIYGSLPYVLTTDMFTPHEEGWIESRVVLGRHSRNRYLSVDFTHGYEALPKAVAEVGYELTATVVEKPAGVVTEMQRGPTSLTFKEFGAVLSDDQKARLGPYTITRV